MAYGLLNAGNSTKRQAMHGFKQDADAEQQRNIANEGIKAAEEASDKSVMGAGASLGLMQGLGSAGTAGTMANSAAVATVGAEAAGTAGLIAGEVGTGATMGATAIGGAATMGVGLIAAWALTELL